MSDLRIFCTLETNEPKRLFWLFNFLLILMCALILFPTQSKAFDYFEHRYIGDFAYEKAVGPIGIDGKFKEDLCIANFWLGIWTAYPENDSSEECKNPFNKKEEEIDLTIEGKDAVFKLEEVPVSFGDITALAGDHAENPVELLRMLRDFGYPNQTDREWARIIAVRRQWEEVCSQLRPISPTLRTCLKDLKQFFKGEKIHNFSSKYSRRVLIPKSEGYEPSLQELEEFEELPNYVSLVKDNRDHFPKYSWDKYHDNHRIALEFAQSYQQIKKVKPSFPFSKSDCLRFIYIIPEKISTSIVKNHLSTFYCHVEKERENLPVESFLLAQALIYEGFAQHFLHDSYSAGHIGTPYGGCWFELVLPLFCSPPKRQIQYHHDKLNSAGINVRPTQEGRNFPDTWIAYGDHNLLTPEANKHRFWVINEATNSIKELFEKAQGIENKEWKVTFPVPHKKSDLGNNSPSTQLNYSSQCQDKNCQEDLAQQRDVRVQNLQYKGTKVLATWGLEYGKLDAFNPDGSLQIPRNSTDGGTLELAYYYKLPGWTPNMYGVGGFLVPDVRTSIFGFIGWWYEFSSYPIFMGLRITLGPRVEEPFTQENRTSRRRAQGEISFPLDFGLRVYPPFSLYLRANVASIVLRGLGDKNIVNQAKIESFLNGFGAVTIGIRFDVAGKGSIYH